jgi:hypothetical protein
LVNVRVVVFPRLPTLSFGCHSLSDSAFASSRWLLIPALMEIRGGLLPSLLLPPPILIVLLLCSVKSWARLHLGNTESLITKVGRPCPE